MLCQVNLKHSLSSFLWFSTQEGEDLAADVGIRVGLGRGKAQESVGAFGVREGTREGRRR